MKNSLLLSVILELLVTSSEAKTELDGPITLNFKLTASNALTYPAATFLMTSTKEPVLLLPDLTQDTLIVGNEQAVNFGVTCTPQTQCFIMNPDLVNCSAVSTPEDKGICREATTQLTFDEKNNATTLIQFSLLEVLETWKPQKLGVLGLSPSSSFWPYLLNNFSSKENDFIDIGLFYRAVDLKDLPVQTQENYEQAIMTINGQGIARRSNSDQIFIPLEDSKSPFWKTGDAFVSTSSQTNDRKVTLCISNRVNKTLLVDNFAEVKKNIFEKLCGNAEKCSRVGSRVNNVDKIKLKFDQGGGGKILEIKIEPAEMLYFDNEGDALLLIGDIQDPQFSSVCGSRQTNQPDVVIGRLALSRRELVLRQTKDGSLSFTFTPFNPEWTYTVILSFLAAVFGVFVVGMFVLVSFNRLKDGEELSGGDRSSRGRTKTSRSRSRPHRSASRGRSSSSRKPRSNKAGGLGGREGRVPSNQLNNNHSSNNQQLLTGTHAGGSRRDGEAGGMMVEGGGTTTEYLRTEEYSLKKPLLVQGEAKVGGGGYNRGRDDDDGELDALN